MEDKERFNIDLSLELHSTSDEAVYRDAYIEARNKWMEVITGDLPSYPLNSIPNVADWRGDCTNPLPSSIDDLHICVREGYIAIDLLGAAGPLWTRTDPITKKVTTVTGDMELNIYHIKEMINSGKIKEVILHEMGHILGLGSLWEKKFNDLLDENNDYRVGTKAAGVWSKDWGCVGTPPIEKVGGDGTAFTHWDEECLRDELMTGYGDDRSISKLTIGSLEDNGYKFNYDAADDFDGSDTSCCTTGAGAALSTQNKPTLSDTGREYAVAYGQEILRKHELPVDVALLQAEYDTGLTYVGDKIVVVLVIEYGIIFEVFVTNNDE
ncbi:hypothetical protein ACHAW5_004136 [Stephanodiscus triporus]|uniref:Peptidase M10 metallopeptidase domain-containing protein n=1 Tax=Stephanodiscus triporus TaxID=2934178 RepID=A0ABD3QGM2_9STRA